VLVLHNRKQKTAMWSLAAVARGTACGIACMALLQLAELAAAVSPSAGGAGGHHHGAAGAAKSAQLKADVGMNVLPQGQIELPAAAPGDATPGAAVPAAGGLMRSESSTAGARAATLKESYSAAVHAVHAAAHPHAARELMHAHARLGEAAVSGDGSVQLEADSVSADGSLLELDAASESVESAHAEAALESDSAGRKSASESELQMIPGMSGMSATDALRKGEDILMGTTSIIPEDYPYVCICGSDGVCAKDAMETPCSGRGEVGSAAYRRAAPLGAVPRLALGSASMLLSMSMLARREA